MKVILNKISGLVEIYPALWSDERGVFFETYHINKFKEAGINESFIQDNQSFSRKGVVRGLHFQKDPFAQGKLVRVITGKALDVVVDIRKGSPTFGQTAKFLLEADKNNMVYIPAGFAHGFAAIEDCIFSYKCTNVYDKTSESGVLWNDKTLNIDWELANPIVSEKDKELPTFAQVTQLINA